MSDCKIGKLGSASVIVCNYVPHDQVWISPKEERMMLSLIKLLEGHEKVKTLKQLTEALEKVAEQV